MAHSYLKVGSNYFVSRLGKSQLAAVGLIANLCLSACGGGEATQEKTGSVTVTQAGTPVPVSTPTPAPIATPTPSPSIRSTAERDRLGVNVAGISYYGGEPTFANQLFGLRWLVPTDGWSGINNDRLRSDGFPKLVDGSASSPSVVSILNAPMDAKTTDNAVTRCTWQGTGTVNIGGYAKDQRSGYHSLEFRWMQSTTDANRVWLEITRSDVADPIRAVDCRLTTDPADSFFAPQLLAYLKPFGLLRFLDQSAANGNPSSVTWATRTLPNDVAAHGTDGVAIENMIALANANNSSPWFTIPWNADADYQRRMAQLVHDTVPAGKPVYVEISNEVWNYGFGQAGQAQKEGLERGLSSNGYSAALFRYNQKLMEVMPIWTAIFKDRPKDLVRVAATQAANVWVGGNLFEWNNGAAIPYFDAVAIAPYFSIGGVDLTDNHQANMTALAKSARAAISGQAAPYKALADKYGKRLIAYEGGQHQLDPDNQARLEAMNRDPQMQNIYKQYLTDWNALTGDVFTLYAATGGISRYGAWGLREYAGQPLSETPKLRGVLEYAGKN